VEGEFSSGPCLAKKQSKKKKVKKCIVLKCQMFSFEAEGSQLDVLHAGLVIDLHICKINCIIENDAIYIEVNVYFDIALNLYLNSSREACRDPDNLNRLACSLVERLAPDQRTL
jgi:hypothetical protein